jgi:hypothetical protein
LFSIGDEPNTDIGRKKNFEQAKAAATKWLDACPSEVIRKFINLSW